MIFLGLYVVAVLFAIAMVLKNPSTGLVVVYCMFVFEQWAQASHPIFVQFSWITNVVGGLIVVLAAFMVLAKKRTQRKSWSFGTKSVWALFVFAFLSIGPGALGGEIPVSLDGIDSRPMDSEGRARSDACL